MDWPTLDTRWWNLSLGVVATTAMAACGPMITLDGEDSITDSDTDGPDTDGPDTIEPPPGNCQIHADCEPGDICVDNVCVPDETYYCQDGGCCYDYGYDGCCYEDCCYGECYYEECFDDAQCGPGALCEYWSCQVVPTLPACDQPALASLPLPDEDDDPIVSLAFVDANGDEAEDLLVGRTSGARLHLGGEGTVVDLPLPEGELVIDAVSGDFDVDGDPDLAITNGDDSITILLGDGAGGFTLGSTTAVGSAIVQLEVLRWNSDAAPDLAGLTSIGTAVIHHGDGMGGILAGATLHGDGNNHSMAAGRLNGDSLDDLVMQDPDETMIFLGNDEEDVSIGGSLPEPEPGSEWAEPPFARRLLAGDFDQGGLSEVIGHTNKTSEWLLLETWTDGVVLERYALERWVDHGQLGDYDGDGVPDIVMAGDQHLVLVQGLQGSPAVGCQTEVAVGVDVEHLAVGDFNGDGRAEIAIAHDGQLLVLATE